MPFASPRVLSLRVPPFACVSCCCLLCPRRKAIHQACWQGPRLQFPLRQGPRRQLWPLCRAAFFAAWALCWALEILEKAKSVTKFFRSSKVARDRMGCSTALEYRDSASSIARAPLRLEGPRETAEFRRREALVILRSFVQLLPAYWAPVDDKERRMRERQLKLNAERALARRLEVHAPFMSSQMGKGGDRRKCSPCDWVASSAPGSRSNSRTVSTERPGVLR